MKDHHSTLKGYFFALIYVLALSNVYIFSKAALKEVHVSHSQTIPIHLMEGFL
jgi:hypothetical protein